ncbi:hypothetical protein [Streptomonospora litoralis]|nr:hypothetical protein [Streptomonospora litoralis]
MSPMSSVVGGTARARWAALWPAERRADQARSPRATLSSVPALRGRVRRYDLPEERPIVG